MAEMELLQQEEVKDRYKVVFLCFAIDRYKVVFLHFSIRKHRYLSFQSR